jgi:hypothetical protein
MGGIGLRRFVTGWWCWRNTKLLNLEAVMNVFSVVHFKKVCNTKSSKSHEFATKPIMGLKIVDDSITVQYTWNEKKKMFEGTFERSKINRSQILSYYLADNEIPKLAVVSYLMITDWLKDLPASVQQLLRFPYTAFDDSQVPMSAPVLRA